jgi:hypothetical protein
MKCATAAVLTLTVMVSESALATGHCYTFRNDSTAVATLSFSYSQSLGGLITGATIDPGKTYPFDGKPWCWNSDERYTATVTVSAPGVPGWTGKLVLGNGSQTAASGTYVVTAPVTAVPPAAASATQSPACLANSFPNNGAYCLTALERGVHLRCGAGHTGVSGTIVVDYLTVSCVNGRRWKLICTTGTGARQLCNVNDHAICTGENPWNAADYCTH